MARPRLLVIDDDDDIIDREPFPDFGTRTCRGVDEHRVEHRAPRGVGSAMAVDRQ